MGRWVAERSKKQRAAGLPFQRFCGRMFRPPCPPIVAASQFHYLHAFGGVTNQLGKSLYRASRSQQRICNTQTRSMRYSSWLSASGGSPLLF